MEVVEVLYIPELTVNLLSVSTLYESGFGVVFYGVLTASPTQVVNSCAMKRGIIKCHVVEDFWFYRAMFGPNTLFCNWNFRTPVWVNNVIGLHESCLGQ
jgi:hypothetical protein